MCVNNDSQRILIAFIQDGRQSIFFRDGAGGLIDLLLIFLDQLFLFGLNFAIEILKPTLIIFKLHPKLLLFFSLQGIADALVFLFQFAFYSFEFFIVRRDDALPSGRKLFEPIQGALSGLGPNAHEAARAFLAAMVDDESREGVLRFIAQADRARRPR